MDKKKVIIFGCQAISINILRYLARLKNIEIPKIYTYEILSDISRGQESIIDVAKNLKIPISSPKTISKRTIEEVKSFNPDLILSAYYRKIFPESLIKLPKLGVINIHPSYLPFYRGPVPTAWAILNAEKKFGITIHKVDKGIDTGDILIQKKYPIYDDESGFELYMRAMDLGAKLFIENFSKILNNKVKPKKQKSGGSYFGKLKTRVFIDWKDSAQNIKNQVRVRSKPYNTMETILENKYFFINKVSIVNNQNFSIQIPGKILKVYKDETFLVSCSNGIIHVKEYDVYPQFEGIEKQIYLKSGRRFEDL